MKSTGVLLATGVILSLICALNSSVAQTTTFTYQGHLSDGGTNANGAYDFIFSLFAVSNGGPRIAGPITNADVAVTNGFSSPPVPDGSAGIPGNALWLDISVCANGAGTFTGLTARQSLTPVPQAIYAENATKLLGTLPASQLSGTPNASVSFTGNLNGDVTGTQGATQLATIGTPGTYAEVTTDTKGRVIAGYGVADVGHGGTGQTSAASAASAVGVAQIPGPPERQINSITGNYGGQPEFLTTGR